MQEFFKSRSRADALVGLPTKASGLRFFNMAWVYILQTKSGKYYVGSTENISARLRHHFGGHTPSTKSMGAEKLLLKQEYRNLKEARYIESKIKSFKRRDYIEKILKDGYIRLTPL